MVIGILLFAIGAMAALGIYSYMTAATASNILGGALGIVGGVATSIGNIYLHYGTVLKLGLQGEGWGFTLLLTGTVLFIIVMGINFLSSEGETLVN